MFWMPNALAVVRACRETPPRSELRYLPLEGSPNGKQYEASRRFRHSDFSRLAEAMRSSKPSNTGVLYGVMVWAL